MALFYSSFTESILTFAMICLFGTLKVRSKTKLQKSDEHLFQVHQTVSAYSVFFVYHRHLEEGWKGGRT